VGASGEVEKSETITCKTFGNVPESPNRLAFQVTSATSLHVSWGEPAVTNGPITGYEVKYEPSADESKQSSATSVVPTVVKIPNGSYRSLLVEGLIENTTYLYSVRAENEAGYGPWQMAKMTIDHKIGTRPTSEIFLDEQQQQSLQASIHEQQRKTEQQSSSSGKTVITQEITETTTKQRQRRQQPATPKTVTSTDVTTRITRYLRAKPGQATGQKEVNEYPGRLTREEIEKLTVGCEKVEVNVMTRSLKKTVPGDSPMLKSTAAGSSAGGPKQTKKGSSTAAGDVTTVTKTIKTTSQAAHQQRQQQQQQQQKSTSKTHVSSKQLKKRK